LFVVVDWECWRWFDSWGGGVGGCGNSSDSDGRFVCNNCILMDMSKSMQVYFLPEKHISMIQQLVFILKVFPS
jgi:hypothetical protein